MFLQGLYIALLSWNNSHVGSTWFLVYYVGSWSGQVRSLKISFSWMIKFFDCLAVVHWWQFTRLYYFADRDLRDLVIFADRNSRDRVIFDDRDLCDRVIFVGPRFKPQAKQCDLFYWSWIRFPGQIACFRPVWFMAYVSYHSLMNQKHSCLYFLD